MCNLSSELGLCEPNDSEVASSQQYQDFRNEFQSSADEVNQCLEEAVLYTPAPDYDQLVCQRDDSYSQYQETLQCIDPEDESAASQPIENTCSTVSGLVNEAQEVQRQAKECYDAWMARETEFETAIDQLQEIEDWGFSNDAPALRTTADEIQANVNEKQFQAATDALDGFLTALSPAYEEYEAQRDAQEEYDANVDRIVADVDTALANPLVTGESSPTSEPVCSPTIESAQTQLENTRAEMENAVYNNDFVVALDHMLCLPDLATAYTTAVEEQEAKEQAEAQSYYDANYSGIEADLNEALAVSNSDSEVQKAFQPLSDTNSEMEVAVSNGDYKSAITPLDKIPELLTAFTTALEEYEIRIQREQFESTLEQLKPTLDKALANECSPDASYDDIIFALHEKIVNKNTEMENAADSEDFEAAYKCLDELIPLVEEFHAEKAKIERTCDWINAVAVSLNASIDQKYLSASSKILAAADHYDDALKEFNAVHDSIDAKKKLVADVLAGVFFAALGGGVGAAIGGPLAKKFGEMGKDILVDATKKVVDYTGTLATALGGDKTNPLGSISSVGGNGVELARQVGQKINEQGIILKQEVQRLADLVADNSDKCIDDGTLRVAGDPRDAMKSDPFLAVLGGISNANKQSFAKSLWAEWIQRHAYTVKMVRTCYGDKFDKICKEDAYVDDSDIEGFFAWWGDLKDHIVKQAGEDFGLEKRLQELRAEAEARAAATPTQYDF